MIAAATGSLEVELMTVLEGVLLLLMGGGIEDEEGSDAFGSSVVFTSVLLLVSILLQPALSRTLHRVAWNGFSNVSVKLGWMV